MKTNTIAIIGMKHLGASIGLALKASPTKFNLIGYDSDHDVAKAAKTLHNAIDRAERNLVRAVSKADIVVLTSPFSELNETLRIIGSELQSHTLVIDLGSLKASAIEWSDKYFQQGFYIGARAVLSASAFASADSSDKISADLFQNSVFCIMAAGHTEPKAVETAVNFGKLIGAKPYFVDPKEHDILVQGLETLPGLMAAALFSASHKSTAWRDMMRFADMPFAQATQALATSAETANLAFNDPKATLHWLDALISELQEVRHWVQEGDAEVLEARLEGLDDERLRWLHARTKNEWLEEKRPNLNEINMGERMLGSVLSNNFGQGNK